MTPDTPERLDPADHPWMRSAPAVAAIAALEAAQPDSARFVGGCVRNALMGLAVSDLDVATTLTPDAVMAALKAAGVRAVPTGLEHGTVTAIVDGTPVEITTLRRDVATDGRRATVAFTTDWRVDSQRRDFRFNAIYCAPDGTLFDPQSGAADARAQRVVFIGDPDRRIAEDALRILRFFRFHAQLGHGRPDRDGLLACTRGKGLIANLSGERVWAEMKKLLCAASPEAALRWMNTTGVLEAAIGPCSGLEDAAQMAALRRERDWTANPVLMLAALTGADEARAKRLALRLKMSREERVSMMRASRISGADSLAIDSSDAEFNRALQESLYRDGPVAVTERAQLRWTRARARDAWSSGDAYTDEVRFAQAIDSAELWQAPEFPISGKDLKARGFTEGKPLGAMLEQLEGRWIDSGFTLTHDQLMTIADEISAQ